jgi:hypothetical protein
MPRIARLIAKESEAVYHVSCPGPHETGERGLSTEMAVGDDIDALKWAH